MGHFICSELVMKGCLQVSLFDPSTYKGLFEGFNFIFGAGFKEVVILLRFSLRKLSEFFSREL